MKLPKVFILVTIPWLLAGCAGVGVVATSDPIAKIHDANYLYTRQNRPLIAERLIWEAMEILRERQDFHWLGNAHREYADLLLSSSVVRWRTAYSKYGFRDRTVTFEGRFEKAKEYYSRARKLYWRAEPSLKADQVYDSLVNLYYNMAYVSFRLGDTEVTCKFLEKAVDAYAEGITQDSDTKPYIPPEYDSLEDLIQDTPMGQACA